MGGFGSGKNSQRWRYSKKTVVEDCLTIDASRWAREGILRSGVRQYGTWRWTYRGGGSFSVDFLVDTLDSNCAILGLTYSWKWTSTGQCETADYHVELAATTQWFGGLRWWFVCPRVVNGWSCDRRVAKLYLPPLARYFLCRQCHRLTYRSCQESHKYDRLYRFTARHMGIDLASVEHALKGVGRRNVR